MDLQINQEKLKSTIAAHGQKSIENRQVASRLRQLLPDQLKRLLARHRRSKTVARAERLALVDPDYLKAIENLVEFSNAALTARVQYDTHMMLLEARRSLRRHSPPS